jgi:hypothetical protein
MVAQRAGLEHPTILHLHLARLILLTPAATFQSLASILLHHANLGSVPSNSPSSQFYKDKGEVMRWFTQDQYKARLAIVHAGAVFWHVRRYSHDSVLEPFAVFLSTLALWAYATSSQAITQQKRQRETSSLNLMGLNRKHVPGGQLGKQQQAEVREDDSDDEEIDSPFINLDRLCDDELIQTFVLHGAKMTGYMAGIGNICDEKSSWKILREGAKILANSGTHLVSAPSQTTNAAIMTIPTWGTASKYAVLLEELAHAGRI